MRTYITAFMLVATLGLVSCGGGNDVASSGASAVSAAAPATTPSTTPATPTTEPKVNGQIDERTGVAPVAAQATIGAECANNGVTNIQAGLPCSFVNCTVVIYNNQIDNIAMPFNWVSTCQGLLQDNYNNPNQCNFIGGVPMGTGCFGGFI